jgi:hypothetical protein
MAKEIILGVGTDNLLYARATLDSGWVQVPNSGAVIGVTIMPDGHPKSAQK